MELGACIALTCSRIAEIIEFTFARRQARTVRPYAIGAALLAAGADAGRRSYGDRAGIGARDGSRGIACRALGNAATRRILGTPAERSFMACAGFR